MWRGVYYVGFTAWKVGSGQDSLSAFANPQFTSTSPTAPNLHLLANSPARNAGDSSTDLAASEWGPDLANGKLTRSTGNVTGAALTVLLDVSGTATNGADYATLSSLTFPAGSLTANFTLTPMADNLAEGPETAIITPSSATGAYTNASATPITITIADRPLQQWKFTNFGANANTPSLADDNADPDGDGRPNLMEYALGTPPLITNQGSPLTVNLINGYCTATIPRTAKPVDVTLTPQICSTPVTWMEAPILVILENTATKLSFRDASLASGNKHRFFRVKVTASANP
jgi:hypothetical protein